ncbi:hypothetical protein TCON_2650 [Astathelohania contejeani]|uniref:Uncharacterized protein n=1 Tax=Astathelohania contejeani TaxID=164912 RepID=A0ABQ7HVE7_9MICR|nr:hypothetical protein TCON_2650 [Thelohania contejeani]
MSYNRKDIEKTISLIKKSHSQPLIFHMLHSHLCFLLKTTEYHPTMNDDWSQIILYSATETVIQKMETKINQFVKNVRYVRPLDNINQYKLKIIMYSILNKKTVNLFTLYELITHFMGISTMLDRLIINSLQKHMLATFYKIESPKKMQSQAIKSFLTEITKSQMSYLNKAKLIPCYIFYDIEPVDFTNVYSDVLSIDAPGTDIITLRILEGICMYAKYTKYTSYFKSIIPNTNDFIQLFNQFLAKSLPCNEIKKGEYNVYLDDHYVFDVIRNEYVYCKDKCKFKEDLIEFITKLK